jgi:hypothetical protein
MNEFDLQGWEREIQAWRRRLDAQGAASETTPEKAPDTTVLRAELNDIQRDIVELRENPASESDTRNRVERRLVRLLALYDLACRGRVGSA